LLGDPLRLSHSRIGMMQGRLSPINNGRIQSFPSENWEKEMIEASELKFRKVEWTIDSEDFYSNPLMSIDGCNRIIDSKSKSKLDIPSVTCDYFMENPPWKGSRDEILRNMKSIISGMSAIDASILVVPLVDNSSVKGSSEAKSVVDFFNSIHNELIKSNVKIAIESDFGPQEFHAFMERLDPKYFSVNYDIGNSASLGFNPVEEFAFIGDRISNVHVKDRILNGTTVPLGEGAANFEQVFKCLKEVNYEGNYILQTARASDGDHSASIIRYRNQVVNWLEESL
jgi:L-ribulose-5-phosphate 3-epimerase